MPAGDAGSLEASIRARVLAIASGADGKIMCQAEGEDGVMSALILYAQRGKAVLKFPDQALTDALIAHWDAAAKAGKPWAALTVTIEGGRTSFAAFGPEAHTPPLLERRIPDLAMEHFGVTEWDDSDPEPNPQRKPWWRLW
jgi:hypothetical protein